MLRDYQQAAFDAALSHITKSIEPCLIEAATGAGKSHIIAAIAHWLNDKSKKRVLVLAPSKELVEQDHQKYCMIEPASLYSASAGQKSLRYPVVFGTPQTVKNNLRRFKEGFAAVVIDEAHGITPTIKTIIEGMKEGNEKLRVIGLTATPFRTQDGYIYELNPDNSPVPEDQTREPYFKKLVYRITAPELIERGFLTPPTTEVHDGYDTSKLEKDRTGRWSSESVELVFEGHGRKTSMIVADVVESCRDRKGVLFFAATLAHADEIQSSLPADNCRVISGSIKKAEREKIIADFKAQKFKYLINRDVLTTGFDAPHVDAIAILRKTESAGLLQQIIGRGLRLDDGKKDCLILDYADNLRDHFPDGGIFAPEIKAKYKKGDSEPIDVECPECSTVNQFTMRPNPDEFNLSPDGYFMDLAGVKLEMPSHFGRRCLGQFLHRGGKYSRCEYRWTAKECPECGHENDIAARFCESCKAEIIDPNEKLKLEYQKIKTSPHLVSTDKVLAWECKEHISAKGNQTLLIFWTTEYRTFRVYYMPTKKREWRELSQAVFDNPNCPTVDKFLAVVNERGTMPRTITGHRPKGKPFFNVIGYNKEEDEKPEEY